MLVWVSYLEALSIVCFKRSWQFCLPPTCHSWKRAWRSCCSWKIFTTKKISASSTYFRITNIFRYSTDEWKRSWNFIKTPKYFLPYRVTKTTVSVFQNQVALEKLHGVKFTGAYSVSNSGRSLVITDHLDLLVGQ